MAGECAVAEVVVVEELAVRRGEDEATLVRLPREQLTAEDTRRGAREVDASARRTRLHAHELASVGAALDLDGHGVEVEVAVAQREQLVDCADRSSAFGDRIRRARVDARPGSRHSVGTAEAHTKSVVRQHLRDEGVELLAVCALNREYHHSTSVIC
jgi:hypothetical protein